AESGRRARASARRWCPRKRSGVDPRVEVGEEVVEPLRDRREVGLLGENPAELVHLVEEATDQAQLPLSVRDRLGHCFGGPGLRLGLGDELACLGISVDLAFAHGCWVAWRTRSPPTASTSAPSWTTAGGTAAAPGPSPPRAPWERRDSPLPTVGAERSGTLRRMRRSSGMAATARRRGWRRGG